MSEEIALDAVGRRYQISREVGRGGMSVVYEAADPRIGRRVAIKLLHPHLATREDARRRFLQEATAIALLENRHILKVYDYDSPDGAASYIVSEYIDGLTFRQWVEEHGIKHWEVVALLCIPLFDALDHAHQHKIIHRDVKPENMMIRSHDGSPVLMDFGIAHMIDSETLTATGAVIGSPAHMAPEIVNGEALTPNADLFSMGTVLYWMTCGCLPFVAPNPAALFKRILETRFDPISERRPDVSPSFAALVEWCMKRDPVDRPKNAAFVADHLRDLLKYAGLTDLQTLLRELIQDPHGFQSQLPSRMTPHYCASATEALEAGNATLALELAERAGDLTPESSTAQKLIEKARKTLKRKRSQSLSLYFASAVSVISLLLSFGPDLFGRTGEVNALGELGTVEQASQRNQAVKTTLPLIKSEEKEVSAGAGAIGSATLIDSPSEVSSFDKNPEDVVLPTTSQINVSRTSGRGTPAPRKMGISEPKPKPFSKQFISPKRKFRSQTLKDQTPKQLQRIRVSSRNKGVRVLLDGKFVGHIYELDTSGGLSISIGEKHTLVFKSPFCEERRQALYYDTQQPTPPQIVFECILKPALFVIKSDEDAEVFLAGERPRRLGKTNQLITYPLDVAEAKIDLLIVSSRGVSTPIALRVAAGQRRELAWP